MKCITVSYGRVRGRARRFQYWQPAVYREGRTKSGKLVWKLHSLPDFVARRSYRLAEQDAKAWGVGIGLPYFEHIRHNQPITAEQVLRFECE